MRWSPQVDTAARGRLEQRYGLADGAPTDGRTFAYNLTNLSTENIRAMVLDPAVEDTHRIHRTKYRIWRFAPRSAYKGNAAFWGPFLEATTLLALVAALLVWASRFWSLGWRIRPGHVAASIVRAVRAQIPDGTAEAVGLFRILVGLCLVTIVWSQQPVPGRFLLDRPEDLSTLQQLIRAPFEAMPDAVGLVFPWIAVTGVLFIVGLATRFAFALLVAGLLAWAALISSGNGHHPVSAPLFTLLCLLPSRWGDAWSVDAWLRRRRGLAPASAPAMVYGYTLWFPGVLFGIVFLAAALTKLRESGLDWALNGSVKYHFVSDAAQAPVDWGMRVGQHPWLAVFLSFAALVIEATVIVGMLSRRYWPRALAGLAVAAILGGFWLFQGLFWPAWWLLLLSLLPWHRLAAGQQTLGTGHAQAHWPAVLVILAMAQQVIMSGVELEQSPLLSTYEMYTTSYASAEAFEAQSPPAYWLLTNDDRQCEVKQADATAILAGGGIPFIERCFGERVDPARLRVEVWRVSLDWNRWPPISEAKTLLGAPPAP